MSGGAIREGVEQAMELRFHFSVTYRAWNLLFSVGEFCDFSSEPRGGVLSTPTSKPGCPSSAQVSVESLLLTTHDSSTVHQLYRSAPGKGVVWKVEICVGTLPLWGLWLLRLLPGPLLDLQFPQLVQEDRHHAFAFSEGCPAPFPHIAYPRPSVFLCV